MVEPSKYLSARCSCLTTKNRIGDKGMRYLSKTRWRKLDKINLGKMSDKAGLNSIKSEGCRLLHAFSFMNKMEIELSAHDKM